MLKIGDTVYRLSGIQEEIAPEKVEQIGVNEDGSIFITDDNDFTIGAASWTFLSREDAERFRTDPETFPKDYAHVDINSLNLQYKPGVDYYYCEPDPYTGVWDIFIEHYSYVQTDGKKVFIGNNESCCTVGVHHFFLTEEEAIEFIEGKNGEFGYIYDMRKK